MKLDGNVIEKYKNIFGAEKTIKKYEKAVLNEKNAELSLGFARKIEGADIKAHAKIVLDSEDFQYNYIFARDVEGADIKAHAEIILKWKDLYYNYKFASNILGSDEKAHGKVILDSKDSRYNYEFAKNVEGADIKAHGKVILDSKDPRYNYEFAKNIKGADIIEHSKVVLNSGDIEYNYLFAKDVKGADVKSHAQLILESEDVKYNFLLLRHLSESINVQQHLDVVMNSDDPLHNSWKELLSKLFPKEQTLAIIKPDGMNNIEKIIGMIYSSGLKIQKYQVRQLDQELLREHYSHLVDRPFYPQLEQFMLSGPVAIMILEGYDAVNKFRKLMGPTDSRKADKDTIRGEFGTDNMYNSVHGSDSKENALIEIERFFELKQKIKNK